MARKDEQHSSPSPDDIRDSAILNKLKCRVDNGEASPIETFLYRSSCFYINFRDWLASPDGRLTTAYIKLQKKGSAGVTFDSLFNIIHRPKIKGVSESDIRTAFSDALLRETKSSRGEPAWLDVAADRYRGNVDASKKRVLHESRIGAKYIEKTMKHRAGAGRLDR